MYALLKLITRSLIKNKKRTAVSIVGITLSSILLLSVVTIADSYKEFTIETAKESEGDYHAIIHDIDLESFEVLMDDDDEILDNFAVTRIVGSHFDSGRVVEAHNSDAIELLYIDITEGRLPSKDNEIIVGKHFSYTHLQNDPLNKNIEVINDGEVYVYTVVGVMNKENRLITHLDANQNDLYNVYFNVLNPKYAKEVIESVLSDYELENVVSYNEQLLRHYGFESSTSNEEGKNILILFAALIGLLISLGSALFIYTSFAISVTERTKDFGILKSIGTTNSQIQRMIFFESLILSFIAIPLGVLISYVLLQVIESRINSIIHLLLYSNSSITMDIVFNPLYVTYVSIFVIIVVLLSVIGPSRKASTTSPIRVLRSNNEVKRRTKADYKLISRFFGVTGRYVKKSIDRNRRRYIVTNISLTASIVIFIVISGAFNYTEQIINGSYDQSNYNVVTTSSLEYYDDFYNSKLQYLEDSVALSLGRALNGKLECDDLSEDYKTLISKGSCDLYVNIISLDDTSYEQYLLDSGISDLSDNEIILLRHPVRNNQAEYFDIDIVLKTIGETIDVTQEYGEHPFTEELFIKAKSDVIPSGVEVYDSGTLNVIVSKSYFSHVVDLLYINDSIAELYVNIDAVDPSATQKELQDYEFNKYTYNLEQERNESMLLVNIINFIGNAFIALVSLIAVVNIFNILTSNMELKKREYASILSIGCSKKDIKKMLFYEGTLYTVNSLLYGSIIGVVLLAILYTILNIDYDIMFKIPFKALAVSVFIVMLLSFIAYNYMSKRIIKGNLIEVIKNEVI